MHPEAEEISDLANAYVCGRLLNNRQLAVKMHMAECRECYCRFCLNYLIRTELIEAGLLPIEAFYTDGKEDAKRTILTISKIRDKINSLSFAVQSEFLEDERWNFFPAFSPAAARGAEDSSIYLSAGAEESRIIYENGRVSIELDKETYLAEEPELLVIEKDKTKTISFFYDEDTEVYRASADIGGCSEEVTVCIVKKRQ